MDYNYQEGYNAGYDAGFNDGMNYVMSKLRENELIPVPENIIISSEMLERLQDRL